MKIGFDSKRLYCNFTGLGNYSRSLLKNLQEYYPKNDYWLYTPQIKLTPETSFFYNNKAFQTYEAKTALKTFWRSFSIVDQLKHDNIDLYHGLSNELPAMLSTRNIKSVVTIHDLIFNILPNTYNFFDRKIYDTKFRYSCDRANKIIAISESTKNDIIKFYKIDPQKIEVIYQSCNPIFYETFDRNEGENLLQKYKLPNEFLLFVGSIAKRKNFKLLVEAYQGLKPSYQIPLVVVGGAYGNKNDLINKIKSLGLQNKIIWLSNLENNYVLKALYQKSMALIYPSLYEGFGLPVAEALLSKTPVITSNVSSLPEAGGPNSLYVDPNNAEMLADTITKVLSNTELRYNMIQKGFEYAIKTFSPQQNTKQLINCYENIMIDTQF